MLRRSARTWLLVPACVLFALAILDVPALAGGGGCHGGVTTGEGDTVEMVEACFTPTTLRISPGGAVTFVNVSPLVHNVTANGWGQFGDLGEGDRFRATFDEAGTYPYACSYHPGMSGAIVVGDGSGAGDGESVSVASYEPPAPSPEIEVRTVPTASAGSSAATGWIAGGSIGLLAGLALGRLARRRASARRAARTTTG